MSGHVMIIGCDTCDAPCDAAWVDGSWSFTCDICHAIATAELESRTVTHTRDIDMTGYLAEKMELDTRAARAALARVASATAALLASIKR